MLKLNRLVKILLCCCMLGIFSGCASTQKRESTGEFIDDSVITTKVKAALFDELTLRSFKIEVKTYRGVVQLSGFVDSQDSVRKAGDVARGIKGVASVSNDLIIK